jgi:chromosome segregation ATPase
MTPGRYYVARFAQAFGILRRAQRISEAASELHLLREAEAYLGMSVWPRCGEIETLSVEYWNLRKLHQQRDELQGRMNETQAKLNEAHEERARLLTALPESNQELLDERSALLVRLEEQSQHRDRIVAEAREVRRVYEGLKMKLQFLTQEAGADAENTAAAEATKQRLGELRARFDELRDERNRIGKEIEKGDAKVDQIDQQLKEERQKRRVEAADSFQTIGESNKEISAIQSETSAFTSQMHQLYIGIGRHVSRNTDRDPACARAARDHRGLVDVMRALRRSIALNHRLSGR